VFGFERGFNERLLAITRADETVRRETNVRGLAEDRVRGLTERQAEIAERITVVREDIAEARRQAQQDASQTDARRETAVARMREDRDRIAAELSAIDDRIARVRRACAANPEQRCNVGGFAQQRQATSARLTAAEAALRERDASAEGTIAEVRQRQNAEVTAKTEEYDRLQGELRSVRDEIGRAQAEVAAAGEAIAQASRRRAEMVERSQLHRLAMTLYGDQDDATVAETKRLFVVSLAAIVAVIGTIIAAMHYASVATANWRQRLVGEAAPRRRRGMLGRAVRGYLARRRRHMSLTERVKLLYVYKPNPSEAEVAAMRREATRPASARVSSVGESVA
jgi:hypothetical protein